MCVSVYNVFFPSFDCRIVLWWWSVFMLCCSMNLRIIMYFLMNPQYTRFAWYKNQLLWNFFQFSFYLFFDICLYFNFFFFFEISLLYTQKNRLNTKYAVHYKYFQRQQKNWNPAAFSGSSFPLSWRNAPVRRRPPLHGQHPVPVVYWWPSFFTFSF